MGAVWGKLPDELLAGTTTRQLMALAEWVANERDARDQTERSKAAWVAITGGRVTERKVPSESDRG